MKKEDVDAEVATLGILKTEILQWESDSGLIDWDLSGPTNGVLDVGPWRVTVAMTLDDQDEVWTGTFGFPHTPDTPEEDCVESNLRDLIDAIETKYGLKFSGYQV